MEERREQIWQYSVNGEPFVTPSESYAAQRDPNAFLIYERND